MVVRRVLPVDARRSAVFRSWLTSNPSSASSYRRIRNFFAVTTQWREFDPFFTSKSETYAASLEAIVHLARALDALPADLQTGSTKSSTAEPGPLEVAFMEMALANLWGNATDLSLLVDLKYEDLQALQSVGREAQKERERYVLRNDLGQAWARVKEMREGKGRVDFVLDNGEWRKSGWAEPRRLISRVFLHQLASR